MRQAQLPIVGGSKFARFPKISDETTYNMIVSDPENGALIPYAGYKLAIPIITTGVGRDLYSSVNYGHMFVIISENVYIVSADNGYSFIGRLRTNDGPVSIAENDKHQVAFADGVSIYIYDTQLQTAIVEVPNLDFSPGYITFMDGYFIAADTSTNEWRLSDINDGLQWPSDTQHIGLLQSKPDLTQATIAFNRQVFVMGKTVTELWYDVGNTLFPFQRNNYLTINYGVVNVETIDSEFNMLVWLGANTEGNLAILATGGGEPEIISTDGIDYLLATLQFPDECSAFLFQDTGHIFYQITWQRDNISLVYDFKTGLFSNVTDTHSGHHIARRAVFFQGTNYFVSSVDGNLYTFGSKYTTYNGQSIPRSRVIPSFRLPDNGRFIANKFEMTIEEGYSKYLTAVDISLSKDGGVTFGNSIRLQLNSLGNRMNKCRVFSLGQANELSIQIRFWAGDHGNNGLALQPDIEYIGNTPVLNSSQRFVVLNATLDYYQ